MADKPASERTEPPTPERLRKARQDGKVPQSQEVSSAIVVGVLLVALAMMAPGLYRWFVEQVRHAFVCCGAAGASEYHAAGYLKTALGASIVVICPFLIAATGASICASLVGSGWCLSGKAVKLDLERISPVKGLKNLVSLRSLVHLLISLVKLVVIVTIIWIYLGDKMGVIMALRWAPPEGVLVGSARLVLGVLVRITIALVAIGGVDLLYQRWNYKRELKMSRQEVKEERKQYEPAPEIKGRMRAIQYEMARKRMLQDVAKADVVVVNPTHLAVALRYDTASMDAPVVVAKGPDLLAQQIRTIAGEHGVPVVHRPELARALYKAVDVGKAVPEILFVAVAEVLAMVYRTGKRRGGAVRT